VSSENSVFIPLDDRCHYDEDGEGECQNLTSTYLAQYIAGGLNWDSEDSYLTITPEDLYNNDQLNLIVPLVSFFDMPSVVESVKKHVRT
jgi:hypothetical protein